MSSVQRALGLGTGILVLWVSLFSLIGSNLFGKQHQLANEQAVAAANKTLRQWIHPFDIPQAKSFPDEVMAVIEIPQGSFTKYEIDPVSGIVAVDRFQSMPVAYPANYGVITSSLAGDGDNLDVLVVSREPLVPGALIKVRPVGILKMLDGGKEDDKVIAVPTTDIDPTYDAVQKIADLPAIEVQRIEAFFRVYKQLPEGRKKVELGGFLDATETKALIKEAIERHRGNVVGASA